MKRLSINEKITSIIIFILLSLFAVIILFPLLWMLLTGLKTNKELFLEPWKWPNELMFSNYLDAWKAGIGLYFKNSVVVTLSATIFSTLLSCFAAYPLARINFKLKRIWIFFILGGLMLAPQSSLISLFKMSKMMNIYNTHIGVILINGAFRIPFSTFLMMTYYKTIDYSMDESAYIDGATTWQVFWSIIIPLSKPIIASAVIICVRSVWNELMFSNILLESNHLKTVPVGLINLQGYTTTNWTMLVAGMVATSVPLIITFLLLQREFIRGLTAGGVKG